MMSRNIRVDEENYNCKFCLNTLGTMEHLLVGCPMITEVWNVCYGWINLSVVPSRSIGDHFRQHNLVGANRIRQIRLKFFWCAVVWMIWKTRNDIIFNNYEFHLQNLLQGVLFHSWSWIKVYDDSFFYFLSQWCLNTGACLLGVRIVAWREKGKRNDYKDIV